MRYSTRLFDIAAFLCIGLLPVALALVSDTTVPPDSRCPDGRIPLNSPQVRCQNLPQLQWAGRRCVIGSSDFACPSGYSCQGDGLCCEVPAAPKFTADLCSLSPSSSNVIDVNGTCASDSDCTVYDSPMTKCCGGKCVLLMQRCFQKLAEYLNIQSTGRMPRQFLPSCTADGAFAPVQSEPRFGLRWCVDPRTGLAQRSGCCLQPLDFNFTSATISVASGMCADLRPCPRDLCAMQTCLARPDARCRVNPCGGCRVEFVDSAGRLVDCQAGLSQCSAKAQGYYDGLAWLRARDQTQWLQTKKTNKPVTSDSRLAASLDTCQADTCVPYNASKLEPPVAASIISSTRPSCPKQTSLLYKCPDRCSAYGGCDSSKRQICCNSGCGLECTTPADMYPEALCRMSISSGHCPAVGCFRMCRRWGYDTARRTCRPFWYAGSGGNNNRYNTWSECMWWMQNCHGRVLLALPVMPQCLGSGYGNTQVSDNAMFWCVTSNGTPTPGTLHADMITCNTAGQLVKNKYYKSVAYLYQGRCANGSWPAWCQDGPVDRTCGSPGITTFADACNGCQLVHVNADGEEVGCQTDATACATASTTCPPPTSAPRFDYSSASGRCDASAAPPPAAADAGSCASPTSATAAAPPRPGYTREAGCLQACAAGWCPNTTAPFTFYPDLCMSPTTRCRTPGAVCVPDDCTGRERFVLANGTEVAECSAQLAPLSLNTVASCSSAQTSTTVSTAASTTVTSRATGSATNGTRSGNTTVSAAASLPATTATVAGSTLPPAVTTTNQFTSASMPLAPTAMPTTTTPRPKAILPICRLRTQLGIEVFRCRTSDGRYEPKQCNLTHCFCVITDSGAVLAGGSAAVSLGNASALSCPTVETTNLSLSISYDYEYLNVLPTMEDEALFQQVVTSKFAYEGGLRVTNIRQVDLEPGSIIVNVALTKTPGDASTDLPAASFELKTLALKQSLTIDFKGMSLAPSARQDFNENSGSSVVEALVSITSAPPVVGADGIIVAVNVAGIVAGVLITVVVVAVSGVIVAFALRRRSLLTGAQQPPNETGDYEIMSDASGSTGPNAYDNFTNQVYAPIGDVYDNISRPAASKA